MTTLSIQIKGAQLKRQGLQDLKRDIPIIGAERIYNAMLKAQALLKRAGKRIKYPVWWDSEKQRRAYFATNGFGGGIPSRRTGAYNAAWVIRRNGGSGTGNRASAGYSLINRLGYAKYVGGAADGTGQSAIHIDRWTLTRDAVEKAVRGLPQDIEAHIAMVARRRLG